MNVSDNTILEYLKGQPEVHMKSGIIAPRLRHNENKLTHYFTGDQFVYISGEFSPPLHTTTTVDSNKCRVWDKAQ